MSLAAPLVFGLLGLLLMWLCWRYEQSPMVSPRVVCVLAPASAFFLLSGLPPVLYAIAGAAYSDLGITVLLLVDLAGLAVCLFEALLADRFHPIGTPFLASLFGFSLAITRADWPTVSHQMGKLPGKALKAIGKESKHVQATHPAYGHVPHSDYTTLVIFLIAVAVVGFLANGRHKAREERKQQEGGQPAALPQRLAPEGLGVGSRYSEWRAKRRSRRLSRGTFNTRPIPIDAPRPPNGGGRRNENTASTPLVRP